MKTATELLKTNPKDFIRQAIARAKKTEPLYHTLLHFNEAKILEEAKTIDGPFKGLPIVISEALPQKGTPATYGSHLLKDNISAIDAPEILRLKALGLVPFGKGNVSEFGLSFETENGLAPPTKNPLNPVMTPGGGASGPAAAVASGIAPFALGTDVSGALRVGASLTGTFGLLPSRGQMPIVRPHLLPYTERMFYRKGPIARTLEDLKLLWDALASEKYTKTGPYHIASSLDFGAFAVSPEVAEVFRATENALQKAGHKVTRAQLKLPRDLLSHFKAIFSTDRYLLISQVMGENLDLMQKMRPETLRFLDIGSKTPAVRYALALTFQGWVEETFEQLFSTYDLLLTPALPVPAWPLGEVPTKVNGIPLDPELGIWEFLLPFNMSGHPALVFPCGLDPRGMPIGMQLAAPRFHEALLFNALA